ncbi:IS110 family transposase [Bradyrhizobium sp. 190]|uniref:IS110 family transposase n=1 Tax=Bradyrhizobium sp. 190 TaxID=2782658 RepID=UPI0035ABA753
MLAYPQQHASLMAIVAEIEASADQIDRLERAIVLEAKHDEDMRRLTTIPGVGAITAATIKALVPDPGGFKSARHFAAWLGLTPRSHSSGGKERLGRISKMGNPELRALLVVGATAVLRVPRNDARARPWLRRSLPEPFKVAAVAQANKMARIIWALLNKSETIGVPTHWRLLRSLSDGRSDRQNDLSGAGRQRARCNNRR